MRVDDDNIVHVAVGNERLFKGEFNFVENDISNAAERKSLDKRNVKQHIPKGKCLLKDGQADDIREFVKDWKTNTIVFVVVEDELAMCIALGDAIKENAKHAVARIIDMNCKVVMLTGDAPAVATKVLSKFLNLINDANDRHAWIWEFMIAVQDYDRMKNTSMFINSNKKDIMF